MPDHDAPNPTDTPSHTEWRHNPEIRQRMRQAAAYHARGLTIAESARRLGVDRSTVYRDLDRLRTLWQAERIDSANEERREALAATTDVARHAWNHLETPDVTRDPAAVARLLRIVLQAQRETRFLTDSISKHPDRGPRRPLPPFPD